MPLLVLVSVSLSWFYSIVRLKCTLWNVMHFNMSVDTFADRAVICSWMYMRKESRMNPGQQQLKLKLLGATVFSVKLNGFLFSGS